MVIEVLGYGSATDGTLDVCLPRTRSAGPPARGGPLDSWRQLAHRLHAQHRPAQRVRVDRRAATSRHVSVSTEGAAQPPGRGSALLPVGGSDPPFFVGHSLDERIPLSRSVDFVPSLRERDIDVTFVTGKGHLHAIAMLNHDMRSRIADFLHAKLGAPALG